MKPISISIVVAILLALTADAPASPSCMTKQEARAAYPGAHLYWSGSARCWSDKAGRSQARRYRATPVRDDVEMPKPLPPPPAIIAPEPVPEHPPLRTAEATTVGQYENERWQRFETQRAALEALAATLLPPPRVYTGQLPEPEPLQPEPQPGWLSPWGRLMTAMVLFVGISVGAGLVSRRWMPKLMEGS